MGKDLADHLIARGHRVTAIASRSIYGRSGATLPKRQTIDGIEIHRVGASLFGRSNLIARAADFALFYLLAGLRLLLIPRPDAVVAFTTPPFIALLGLVTRALRSSRAVYWVMDLYPAVPIACGVMSPRSPITRLFSFLGRHLLRRSDAVVVLGRCMRRRALDLGADPERVHLIRVWALDADLSPVPREKNALRRQWNADDRFVVMYSGNFGIAHEARTILGAVELLRNDDRIRFEFVGGGKRRDEVERAIRDRNLTNAAWREYQPRERLAESLSVGDVHLVSIRSGLEGLIVPSKLFGIMAVARPVLYVGSPESEIARIVEEAGCGMLFQEGDSSGLARAIQSLADDRGRAEALGTAGREALIGRYDAGTACSAWSALLECITARDPSPKAAIR